MNPVDTGGSVVNRDREEIRAFEVRVERLDDVIERFGIDRVDLLKVDVEGAETDLLRGAKRTLQLTQRVVFDWPTSPENRAEQLTFEPRDRFHRVWD